MIINSFTAFCSIISCFGLDVPKTGIIPNQNILRYAFTTSCLMIISCFGLDVPRTGMIANQNTIRYKFITSCLMMISCFGLDVPGTGMPLSTSISVSLSSLDSSLK
jgi:hypothetical protein